MTVHLETPAATGGREHPEQPVPAIGDRFAAPGALRFDPGAGEDWPDRVLVRLAAGQTAWCVAPFRGDAPVTWIGTAATATEAPGPALRPQHHRLRFDPDPGRYADTVRRAGVAIAAGTLKKVVLGRWATVHTDPPLSADQLTRRLRQLHPDATVFSVPLAEGAGAPVLLGASPELLISRRGRSIASTPLAGTVPTMDDKAVNYLFKTPAGSFYHSGDSHYSIRFAKHGKDHDVDVAFGSYGENPIGNQDKMSSIDILRMAEALRCKVVIPFHYDVWTNFKADPQEIVDLYDIKKDILQYQFKPFIWDVGGRFTFPNDVNKRKYHYRRGLEDAFTDEQNVPFPSIL